VVVLTVVISEKRTALSEYTNSRSFYSADAAGEAGVNWIRHQYFPPEVVDVSNHVSLAPGFTTLDGPNRYKYDVTFVRKRYRAGWSSDYKDYEFLVVASGASAQQSSSAINVGATRLYREGY